VKLLRNRNILQNFLKRGLRQRKAHLPIVNGGGRVDSIYAFHARDIRMPKSTGECADTEGKLGTAGCKRRRETTWQERPASMISIPSWVWVEVSTSTKDLRALLTEDCEELLAMALPQLAVAKKRIRRAKYDRVCSRPESASVLTADNDDSSGA
jgi:hypothetical protein